MIKAILFDFDQTLVNAADGFRSAEKEAEIKIYTDLGLKNWEDFLSNYRRFRKELHNKSIFSRKDIWLKIYKYYNKIPNLTLIEKWEDDYWEKVKSNRNLFPETEKVLKKLSPYYKLAIITNSQKQGYKKTYPFKDFPGFDRFFDEIIVAGESGLPPKPSPEPFLLCLNNLGISSSNAVYVGDDWNMDIYGAMNTGIKPIWIKHKLVKRSWPDVELSVPIITSLEPLLHLDNILCSKNI